jgi:hypothetical protein
MLLPPFHPGIEYRELTPRQGRRQWRFTTQRLTPLPLRTFHRRGISFHDHTGHQWGSIDGKTLIIEPHYSWNGCSPKITLGPLWLGTPDFEKTRLPSLGHDILYQFSAVPNFPLTRQDVDDLFLHWMLALRFPLARIYHSAVVQFGGPYWQKQTQPLFSRPIP